MQYTKPGPMLLLLFGDVELFFQRNDDLGAVSRQKLLTIIQDQQKGSYIFSRLCLVPLLTRAKHLCKPHLILREMGPWL